MIQTTVETTSKALAGGTAISGGTTSVVSGVWLIQHQDILAVFGIFFGMGLGVAGLIVKTLIDIHYHKKHLELARLHHRRVDDIPLPPDTNLPDGLPEPPSKD